MTHQIGADILTEARRITTCTIRTRDGSYSIKNVVYVGGTTTEEADYIFEITDGAISVLKARDMRPGQYRREDD